MPIDINQFKRGLIYQDRASSAEISASLNKIREFDRGSERRKTNVERLRLYSFFAGIASIATILISGMTVLVPIPILCGVAIIGGIIFGLMTGKNDLPNRRYELVQVLSEMLSRDMPKDAPFDLTLDLAPPDTSRKKVRQDQVGDWTVTYYEDPWLKMEGRFVDGTAFQITMIERHQARKKWARSRSGKPKLKSKSKTATVASVNLFPKQKKYSNLGQVTDRAPQMLRLPTWVRIKKMSADPEKLMIAAVTSADWSVRRHDPKVEYDGTEVVVKMLLSLYQVLHISKAHPSA